MNVWFSLYSTNRQFDFEVCYYVAHIRRLNMPLFLDVIDARMGNLSTIDIIKEIGKRIHAHFASLLKQLSIFESKSQSKFDSESDFEFKWNRIKLWLHRITLFIRISFYYLLWFGFFFLKKSSFPHSIIWLVTVNWQIESFVFVILSNRNICRKSISIAIKKE